ncbi:hypothetical protein ACU61A_39545 [Pseudonocardia sichuanensis]
MATAGVAVPRRSPALQHGLATSALVLLVCAVLAVVAGTAFTSAAHRLDAATARTFGTVTAADGDGAQLRWTPAGGAERTDALELAGPAPPAGTRTEVAYDPAAPDRPLIPGAAVLAAADRSLGTLFLSAATALVVLTACGWQLASRRRAMTRAVRTVPVRRVQVQTGLLTRSWLETDTVPRRFIPVHFDPVLVTLRSPTNVRLYGDPLRDRLVTAEIDGRVLHPSGPVRAVEPRGRRTDNPARPDESTRQRAALLAARSRQWRADLPMLVPAPVIALLWTYVDGGGLSTWLSATALLGALGLWLAALRGSDPSSHPTY